MFNSPISDLDLKIEMQIRAQKGRTVISHLKPILNSSILEIEIQIEMKWKTFLSVQTNCNTAMQTEMREGTVEHFPGRAAAEGDVEGEDEGGEEEAEADADVEVGVVGVEAGLVVFGVVVELGALHGREVFEAEGRVLVTHPKEEERDVRKS